MAFVWTRVSVWGASDTGVEGHLLHSLEDVSCCLSASWPSLAGTLAWLVVRIIAAPWLLAVTHHQQATLALGPGFIAGVRERSQSLLPSHASRQLLLGAGLLGHLVCGRSAAKMFSRMFESFYTLSSNT